MREVQDLYKDFETPENASKVYVLFCLVKYSGRYLIFVFSLLFRVKLKHFAKFSDMTDALAGIGLI